MAQRADVPTPAESTAEVAEPAPTGLEAYESPAIIDLGSVREVTQGSAKNGRADATNQFYN